MFGHPTSFFGGAFFSGEFFNTSYPPGAQAGPSFDQRIMRDDEEVMKTAMLFITLIDG